MAVTTVSRRRSRARAEAAAAKQRREKRMLIAGAVLLALLLAWRLPGTLKQLSGSSAPRSTASASTATQPPAQSAKPAVAGAALGALRHDPAHDPFTTAVSGTPSALGSVAAPKGLHDPFTPSVGTAAAGPAPGVVKATTTTPAKPAKAAPLPEKIVVGKPGAGSVASHGWIVILASIPTGDGRGAASSFAASARSHGVGTVSILNSSNSKPLRGGFWVVYTGPYSSLGAVQSKASAAHAKGFSTAYIRELVVYKQK